MSPGESDILSVFAGLRPLVAGNGGRKETRTISREHSVLVSESGLVTIVGGKWTTYRKMAQDTVDDAAEVGGLPTVPCATENLRLHGWMGRDDPELPHEPDLQVYGSEASSLQAFIAEDPARQVLLHPSLPFVAGQVLWAARCEMARTVEDVLARRTRALLLDARAAIAAAPRVAELLAAELHRDDAWAQAQIESFTTLARGYLPTLA